MATCQICKYRGTPSYKSPCSECKGFSQYEDEKKQTNADRIRSMSDEELAHWINLNGDKDFSYEHCCIAEWRKKPCNNKCVACIAEWLKQPAEREGENDYGKEAKTANKDLR